MELAIDALLQESNPVEKLGDAACYFPLANGRYEVKPGLIPFGTDFGNGVRDRHVFQLDANFAHCRQMKQQARAEQLDKYVQTWNYSDAVAGAIAQFITQRLIQDHPNYFQREARSDRNFNFHNQLTGETLILNADYQLQQALSSHNEPTPPYSSALDALAMQIQEDLTVVSRSGGQHWVSAIHLCFPNYWAATEKIGKNFATVHAPVAGMDAMNRRGDAIVNTMISRPPAVRFAWGLSTDTRLNHHPEPPPTVTRDRWQGRQFNPQNPRLYLRIERQVIWGLPHVDAALFSIRTYFRDCRQLKQDPGLRSCLIAALQSMSAEALGYKGLSESRSAILAWLSE